MQLPDTSPERQPLEEVVERFEQAWQHGRPCLEDFLAAQPTDNLELLVELVHTDLEYRLKVGEDAHVAEYLQRFPKLIELPKQVVELAVAENGHRQDRGQRPAPNDYCRRFPQYPDGLEAGVPPDAVGNVQETLPVGSKGDVTPSRLGAAPNWPKVAGYQIMSELGRGGMGVVYKVWQPNLRRVAALKMILAGAHAGVQERSRFRTEAHAAARLRHPNIVQIYELGERDGCPFLALEYVEGLSLDRKLAGRPLAARAAAELAEVLARTMHHAHEQGVVHRDLKPANVLMTAEGTPKVTDFGLAKLVVDGEGQTLSGSLLGSPSYMAPEQARGNVREVGPATDVYGLGAILYEMLAGRPPFRAATPAETIGQVIADEPVPPSRLRRNLPRDLETICLHSLQKQPERRYASAAALADDLRRFLDNEPIRARPAGSVERTVKWVRRRPFRAALIGVTCLATIGLAGLSMWLWDTLQQREAALELAQTATARALQSEADAQASEAHARLNLYPADMRVVNQLWKNGDLPAMRALLARHGTDPDERGFAWRYFTRLGRDSEGRVLAGHGGAALAVAVSPDGKSVATGGHDGAVRLWERTTRRLCHTLRAHARPVSALAFLNDGDTLASCGDDGVARFWDPTTGNEREPSFHAPDGLNWLVLSRDARLVATMSRGQTSVQVRERTTGQKLCSCKMGFPIVAMGFTPDGAYLAVSDSFGFSFWNTRTGQRKAAKPAPGVQAMAFDGAFVASVYAAGTVVKHDVGKLLADRPDSWMLNLQASSSPLLSVAISPDGETIATGGDDAVVRLWDVRTQALRHVFRGHTERVVCLAFGPDGKSLVSGSADDTALLWDVAAHQDYQVLATPLHAAGPLAFSPDGTTLAVAGSNRDVALVDTASGTTRAWCRGHTGALVALAYTPDGMLVSAGRDKTIRLWHADGRAHANWSLAAVPHGIAISPDGKIVAAGLGNGVVQCWDAVSGAAKGPLSDGTSPIHCLAFAPDSRHLFAGGADHVVRRWDVGTSKAQMLPSQGDTRLRSLAVSRDGRCVVAASEGRRPLALWDNLIATSPIASLPVGETHVLSFSPDDRTLAIGNGNTLYLVDMYSRSLRCVLIDGHGAAIRAVAHHPGGKLLATSAEDGAIKLWDLAEYRMRRPAGQKLGTVRALAFAPDGRQLFVGAADATPWVNSFSSILGIAAHHQAMLPGNDDIRAWNIHDGSEVPALLPRQPGLGTRCLAVTSDGRTLVAGSDGGSVWRWDLPSRKLLPLLFVDNRSRVYWEQVSLARSLWPLTRPHFQQTVDLLAVSPDGRHFATVAGGTTVQLWDAESAEVRLTLPRSAAATMCLAFNANGDTLATGAGTNVQLWDVATGRLLADPLRGHKEPIACLAFSPDGKLLATGGRDRRIHLWDLRGSGPKMRVLAGHTSGVSCLAFAPDSRTLASGSGDRTVRLWHLASAQELATLEEHGGPVSCLAFTSDGQLLASGSPNGEVRLWRSLPVSEPATVQNSPDRNRTSH